MKQKLIQNGLEEKKVIKQRLKVLRLKLWDINKQLPHVLIIKRENIIKQIEGNERQLEHLKGLMNDLN